MSDKGEAHDVAVPETTPERRIVIPPDKRDARGRFLPGVPNVAIRTSERGRELAMRRHEAHAAGIRLGLRQAAAEEEGVTGLSALTSAAKYAKEIGKGIIANSMERPHDAARAYVSLARIGQLAEERKQDASSTSSISVTVSGPIAEALLAWRAGRQDA